LEGTGERMVKQGHSERSEESLNITLSDRPSLTARTQASR
jgi:hypothetical protein